MIQNDTLMGVVLSQLMIGFLLNNNLAPIGSSVISTCSPADLFEQRERNVPLASADVRGGGRLSDEPKERLRRRLGKCTFKFRENRYLEMSKTTNNLIRVSAVEAKIKCKS